MLKIQVLGLYELGKFWIGKAKKVLLSAEHSEHSLFTVHGEFKAGYLIGVDTITVAVHQESGGMLPFGNDWRQF